MCINIILKALLFKNDLFHKTPLGLLSLSHSLLLLLNTHTLSLQQTRADLIELFVRLRNLYSCTRGDMRGPLGPVIGKYPSSSSSDANGGMGSGNNDIIKHNRKCRDVVFLVIFIAFWVAMIVNSSFGFNQGNPLR